MLSDREFGGNGTFSQVPSSNCSSSPRLGALSLLRAFPNRSGAHHDTQQEVSRRCKVIRKQLSDRPAIASNAFLAKFKRCFVVVLALM
jgi:hypothetical protein